MSAKEIESGQPSAKPILLVLSSILVSIVVSVVAGAVYQHGTLAALGNATLLSNLIMGAVGFMLLAPSIHVGIASISSSYRNPRSRRNIYFGWGVAITIIQVLIMVQHYRA